MGRGSFLRGGFGALALALLVSGCGAGSAKASAAFCDAAGKAMPALTGAAGADATLSQTMGNVVADAPSNIKATAGAAADAAAKDASTLAHDANAKKLAAFAKKHCTTNGAAKGDPDASDFCALMKSGNDSTEGPGFSFSASFNGSQTSGSATSAEELKKNARALLEQLDRIRKVAPAELEATFAAFTTQYERLAQTGDARILFALMGDPNVAKLGTYLRDHCGVDPSDDSSSDASDGDDADAKSASGDNTASCALLGPADMRAVLGGDATVNDKIAADNCVWEHSGATSSLSLSVMVWDGEPTTSLLGKREAVPEIGADGALITSARGVPTCVGRKGEKWAELSLGGGTSGSAGAVAPWKLTTPQQRSAFVALCKTAVEHLA